MSRPPRNTQAPLGQHRGKGEDVKRLKAAIVDAFREYAREAAIEVPEDQPAAAA